MKIEARGMSSGRHGSASDFADSRKRAITELITAGVLVQEGAQLFLVEKGRRGKEEKTPVSVHATKGLLLRPQRRSTDPRALLKIPRES